MLLGFHMAYSRIDKYVCDEWANLVYVSCGYDAVSEVQLVLELFSSAKGRARKTGELHVTLAGKVSEIQTPQAPNGGMIIQHGL